MRIAVHSSSELFYALVLVVVPFLNVWSVSLCYCIMPAITTITIMFTIVIITNNHIIALCLWLFLELLMICNLVCRLARSTDALSPRQSCTAPDPGRSIATVRVHVYIYIYICVLCFVCVCLYNCMYTHIYIYVYTHMCVYPYIYIYICIHTYISLSIYI